MGWGVLGDGNRPYYMKRSHSKYSLNSSPTVYSKGGLVLVVGLLYCKYQQSAILRGYRPEQLEKNGLQCTSVGLKASFHGPSAQVLGGS